MKRALKYLLLLVLAIALVLVVLRLFFYDVARIEGEEMLPTFGPGAIVIVRKRATPASGDLVLIEQDGKRRIRRVVGVPGDRVRIAGFEPVVNGVRPSYQEVAEVELVGRPMKILRERLGDREHTILDDQKRTLTDLDEVAVDGGYYVLADHREHAFTTDSREQGVIPASAIRGVVVYVWSRGDVPR